MNKFILYIKEIITIIKDIKMSDNLNKISPSIDGNQMNNVVQNVPFNPNNTTSHYLDMILHSQIAGQIANFNAQHGFNMRNIGILLFMLSIGELRTGLGEVYKGMKWLVKEYYKPFFGGIYNGFSSVYRYITIPKPRFISEPQQYSFLEPRADYREVEIELNPMTEFMQGFINFLESKNTDINKYYSIKNTFDFDIKNMEKEIQKEIWTGINIEFKNLNIFLKNDLNLSFQLTIDKKKLIDFNGTICNDYGSDVFIENPNKIEYFYELINDPILYHVFDGIQYSLKTEDNGYIRTAEKIDKVDINDQRFYDCFNCDITFSQNGPFSELFNSLKNKTFLKFNTECQILRVLKYHFPNLRLIPSYWQLVFYLRIIKTANHYVEVFNKNTNTIDLPGGLSFKIPVGITINPDNYHNIDIKNLFKCSNCDGGSIPFCITDYLLDPKSVVHKDILIMTNNKPSKDVNLKYTEWFISSKPKYIIINGAAAYTTCLSPSLPNRIENHTKPRFGKDKPDNTGPKQSVSDNKLKFVCKSLGMTEQNVRDTFYDFIKHIKSMSFMTRSKDTKINVHRIRMVKNIKEEVIENPEFKEYEERKNQIKELTSSLSSTNESNSKDGLNNNTNQLVLSSVMTELVKIPIPPKTIKKELVTKKVETELINEVFKDFDTLYLRRSDENKLKSVLTKFNSKKELLKSLGLPNKLCVLLSGLPGVGKSSLIQVLGSYLKKDIYYLSFGGTIETNDDLQAVFDHVIKNCNQGIIVAEDIDAVGKLVHRRDFRFAEALGHSETTFNEPNTVDLLDTREEKLSLAYLLNLLQGTLTPDGLIFIATTNHYDKLDDAFTRDGRFDVKIDMKKCDRYQFQKMYQKFIGRNIPEELLLKLPEDTFTPAQFIFHIKDFISEDYEDSVILERFLNNICST